MNTLKDQNIYSVGFLDVFIDGLFFIGLFIFLICSIIKILFDFF